MFRLSACALVLIALTVASLAHGHDAKLPASGDARPVTLDPGLGTLHHPVTTTSRKAQAFFDQGLRLVYAFNHEAAVNSFGQALVHDPKLAMAHWGIALAFGPNINRALDAQTHRIAYQELQQAIALKAGASPAEQDYIAALAVRYSPNPEADVDPLQRAYANAMKALSARYPDDNDAAVLYAESLMDLHPWRLWSGDGVPNEGTEELVSVLERVLARAPDHLGANHYYIHAVEASPHPERALACARRLETLAVSAGHLVHMPAHVYIRTGHYVEAARANRAAIRADERLAKRTGVNSFYQIGYYGHNLHFLAVSEAFAGNAAGAVAAADKLYRIEAPHVQEAPIDLFLFTPALTRVEFGRWDDILRLPEPAFEAPVSGALWHFARALARAGKGDAEAARVERDQFVTAAGTLSKSMDVGNNNAAGLMAVALPYLDGRLALMQGDTAAALPLLRLAVEREDALVYDEPPAWYLPTRDVLGRAQLRAQDYAGAEQTFREELARHAESGRALFGLQAALSAQARSQESAEVQARFRHAWRKADVKPD